MKSKLLWKATAIAAAAALMLTACSGESGGGDAGGDAPDKVALQLNWITNATWSGSYLADENGHYAMPASKSNCARADPTSTSWRR